MINCPRLRKEIYSDICPECPSYNTKCEYPALFSKDTNGNIVAGDGKITCKNCGHAVAKHLDLKTESLGICANCVECKMAKVKDVLIKPKKTEYYKGKMEYEIALNYIDAYGQTMHIRSIKIGKDNAIFKEVEQFVQLKIGTFVAKKIPNLPEGKKIKKLGEY